MDVSSITIDYNLHTVEKDRLDVDPRVGARGCANVAPAAMPPPTVHTEAREGCSVFLSALGRIAHGHGLAGAAFARRLRRRSQHARCAAT